MRTDQGPQGEKKRRKVLLPSQQREARQEPVPTPPVVVQPPEEYEEPEESLEAGPQKTYSTGFILGVLMLAIVLAGGIAIVRLSKRLERLEYRVGTIENAQAVNPFTVGGPDAP